MIESHPHIKSVHIACVLASGLLCAARGLLVQLVVYVALAVLAMQRASASRARLAFYAAAMTTCAYVLGVTRMHHPLGWIVGTFA